MSENLERQLDEVTSYINEYWSFSTEINRFTVLKVFHMMALIVKTILKQSPKKSPEPDFVTGRLAEINKPLYDVITTEEQKRTPAFKAFTSDYPTDAIGSDVEGKYPSIDFNKLKKLHDIKKTKKLTFSIKQHLGFVLAALALILKTVPKKVVENHIGIPYEDFESCLFWVSMAILGYLLLLLVPLWYRNRKASLKHKFIGEILEYIALKRE